MSTEYTLMLIDDDELEHRLFKRIIDRSNLSINIINFYSAVDALNYLQSDHSVDVDLVVLDLNMPIMDGFGFLKTALGKLRDELFIVIMTSSFSPKDKTAGLQFPMVKGFYNKPMSADNLACMINILEIDELTEL